MSVEELKQEALKLPAEERECLGYALLTSVGADEWNESDLPIEILERRLSEMKNDPSKSFSLGEVFPELISGLREK